MAKVVCPQAMLAKPTTLRVASRRVASAPSVAARRSLTILAAMQRAEYIWFDGSEGSPSKGAIFNEMRSKTKVLQEELGLNPADYPDWSFDGSSTGQATGDNSDCILKYDWSNCMRSTFNSPNRPVKVVPDPIRGGNNVLVMCEVLDSASKPHVTNTRAPLAAIIDEAVEKEAPLYGFEQEYTMLGKNGSIFGWPEGGYPAPQGPFYCGVGAESVYGRPLAEEHMDACIQWEYQIGPVGPLELGDQVMLSRWLLHRLGEKHGITITFAPKPVKGDWNGTGAHTNFSTESMRNPGGMKAIEDAIEKLSKTHAEHISQYGTGNEERLTGKHETCDINTFRSGTADRGASIRIPLPVQLKGYGYLEDRRPAANVDPYTVARLLIKTTLKT